MRNIITIVPDYSKESSCTNDAEHMRKSGRC